MPTARARSTRKTKPKAPAADPAPAAAPPVSLGIGNGGGLQVETVPIDSLKGDPQNVRVHDAKNLKAITASLREFGQQHPLVVDAEGVVHAGNGRLEAMRALGWSQVSIVRTSLPPAKLKAFAIADNRTPELAGWNDEGLLAALSAMDETMRGIVGFSAADFDKLPGNAEVKEDTPPAEFQTAVTKAGDVWLLGDHRLLCGSSTVLEDVQRVMAGDKAALVATDPPYLVDYTGKRVGKSGKDWSEEYNEVEIKDADGFFRALFTNALSVMAPHAAIYCWHAHRRVGCLQKVWADLQILDHQQLVWIKPTSVFGSCMYHFQHEPCMVGWRQGSKPKHDGRHGTTSVWVLPSDVRAQVSLDEMSDVIAADWDGKSRPVGNEHPTEKPVEIFARPIRKHTDPGDVVFEPFSGSGSQLSAAEQLGRKCRAIELSPVFVDVAVRRWQRLTGKAAVLQGSGRKARTWVQVAGDRGVVLPKEA